MPDLKDRFRQWARDPARNTLDPAAFPPTAEGARAMIEEAMWIAFDEGYRTCHGDIREAFDQFASPAVNRR